MISLGPDRVTTDDLKSCDIYVEQLLPVIAGLDMLVKRESFVAFWMKILETMRRDDFFRCSDFNPIEFFKQLKRDDMLSDIGIQVGYKDISGVHLSLKHREPRSSAFGMLKQPDPSAIPSAGPSASDAASGATAGNQNQEEQKPEEVAQAAPATQDAQSTQAAQGTQAAQDTEGQEMSLYAMRLEGSIGTQATSILVVNAFMKQLEVFVFSNTIAKQDFAMPEAIRRTTGKKAVVPDTPGQKSISQAFKGGQGQAQVQAAASADPAAAANAPTKEPIYILYYIYIIYILFSFCFKLLPSTEEDDALNQEDEILKDAVPCLPDCGLEDIYPDKQDRLYVLKKPSKIVLNFCGRLHSIVFIGPSDHLRTIVNHVVVVE